MQMPAADNWMTTGSQAQVLSSTYGHHSLRYLCEVLFVIHTDETLRVEISPEFFVHQYAIYSNQLHY